MTFVISKIIFQPIVWSKQVIYIPNQLQSAFQTILGKHKKPVQASGSHRSKQYEAAILLCYKIYVNKYKFVDPILPYVYDTRLHSSMQTMLLSDPLQHGSQSSSLPRKENCSQVQVSPATNHSLQ